MCNPGHFVRDMNIGGEHTIVRSAAPVSRDVQPTMNTGPSVSELTLLIDGKPVGCNRSRLGFFNFISWTGLDIGRDRGSPVSDYESPFEFTGKFIKVTVTMDDDQMPGGDGTGRAQLARE
jgi:hypothetical protein